MNVLPKGRDKLLYESLLQQSKQRYEEREGDVRAAPSCYVMQKQRKYETIGPEDACQHLPGEVALGIDHVDYFWMRAETDINPCRRAGFLRIPIYTESCGRSEASLYSTGQTGANRPVLFQRQAQLQQTAVPSRGTTLRVLGTSAP